MDRGSKGSIFIIVWAGIDLIVGIMDAEFKKLEKAAYFVKNVLRESLLR